MNAFPRTIFSFSCAEQPHLKGPCTHSDLSRALPSPKILFYLFLHTTSGTAAAARHLPRSSSPFYKTQGAPFTPRADEDHPTTTHFRHPRKTQLSTPHLLAPAHLHLTSQGVHAHKSPPSPSGDPELPATRICVTIRLPYRKTFVFLCIYLQSKFTPYAKEGLPRGGDRPVPMDNCARIQGTRSKDLPNELNSGFTQLSRSLPVLLAVFCAFRELYCYFFFSQFIWKYSDSSLRV